MSPDDLDAWLGIAACAHSHEWHARLINEAARYQDHHRLLLQRRARGQSSLAEHAAKSLAAMLAMTTACAWASMYPRLQAALPVSNACAATWRVRHTPRPAARDTHIK
jgi:hypothetical protein